MDSIKSGRYINIVFYAKTCATTEISTVAGYHVVLATLLFIYPTVSKIRFVSTDENRGKTGLVCKKKIKINRD